MQTVMRRFNTFQKIAEDTPSEKSVFFIGV